MKGLGVRDGRLGRRRSLRRRRGGGGACDDDDEEASEERASALRELATEVIKCRPRLKL